MLELKNIHKDYYVDKKPVTAIKNLSLAFADHGFVAILGPSGCGKTTLLNIIGGLDHYTSGDLLIDGKSTKGFKDKDWDAYRNKRIGFVFQSYNLIPHQNILENVEMGLRLGGVSAKERKEKAAAVLERVGLGDSWKKKPNQLSGGQMQRVAIARALANDPAIILADEPTGALDSKTSVQVLDLIKEVGKEKLVIMVTHNEELAFQYADRVIRMKDGEVVGDTAPFVANENEITSRMDNKKTSMSYLTALKSSGKNVWTKKGRTIMTAVACSIGIIGVALVLATRNGFTNYIGNVERAMASSVPLTVSPVTYNLAQMIKTPEVQYPEEPVLNVDDDRDTNYVAHRNRFTDDYVAYLDKLFTDPSLSGMARSVMYNHNNLNFHFLTNDGYDANGKPSSAIKEVKQYSSAGGASSAISSVTGLPATAIHELYGTEKQLSDLYDVVYGRFPEETNNKNVAEMVLIVDSYNQIPYSTLTKLGILSQDSSIKQLNFSDLVYDNASDESYKTYKCYLPGDYYQIDNGNAPVSYVEGGVNGWNIDGIDIGNILDPSKPLIKGSPITKDLKYYKTENNQVIFNNDSKYNAIECRIVGVLRPSKDSFLSLMPTSIGYLKSLKDRMIDNVENGSGKSVADLQKDNWVLYRDETDDSKDGLAKLNAAFRALITASASASEDTSTAESLMSLLDGVFREYSVYGDYSGYLTSIDSYLDTLCRRSGVIFDDGTEIISLGELTNENIAKKLPEILQDFNEHAMYYFADSLAYSPISNVLVFPESLTKKEALCQYLDAYNHVDHDISKEMVADADQILYTDVSSIITGSIGTMINVLSVVLVVFASISLVVSSVMTAIITYVSVIERTKEIGVLRACGARKKDVGRLFEAECIITGGVAGLVGVGVSYILCVPINLILDNLYPGNGLNSIANLNPLHALALLLLSTALAFLSGFIPSRIAAKKDPVICLRTE